MVAASMSDALDSRNFTLLPAASSLHTYSTCEGRGGRALGVLRVCVACLQHRGVPFSVVHSLGADGCAGYCVEGA